MRWSTPVLPVRSLLSLSLSLLQVPTLTEEGFLDMIRASNPTGRAADPVTQCEPIIEKKVPYSRAAVPAYPPVSAVSSTSSYSSYPPKSISSSSSSSSSNKSKAMKVRKVTYQYFVAHCMEQAAAALPSILLSHSLYYASKPRNCLQSLRVTAHAAYSSYLPACLPSCHPAYPSLTSLNPSRTNTHGPSAH